MGREIFYTPPASLLEKVCAFSRGANLHAPRVVRVTSNFNQTAALESCDDAAHGRRLYLLGGRQFAQGFRPAKHQHRERGQLRGTDTRGGILLAHATQQVNGRRVEAVGGGDCLPPERDIFLLDFSHRILLAMLTNLLKEVKT